MLGATSFVGRAVLDGLRSARLPGRVFAFSRRADSSVGSGASSAIRWHRLPSDPGGWRDVVPHWITVCPIWAVSEHFPLLEAAGARRIVALSSTSRFTKRASAAPEERAIAARLAAAEDDVLERARALGIAATILRPTMIYDGVHDGVVARIARWVRAVGFYPVAGAAGGLRQPVHVDDVASACLAATSRDGLSDAYDISGGEVLPYHEMVRRIFAWVGKPPRLIRVSPRLIRACLPLGRLVPGLSTMASMAFRMNEDLVFDHGAAARDLGFDPVPFSLPPRHESMHAGKKPHSTAPS